MLFNVKCSTNEKFAFKMFFCLNRFLKCQTVKLSDTMHHFLVIYLRQDDVREAYFDDTSKNNVKSLKWESVVLNIHNKCTYIEHHALLIVLLGFISFNILLQDNSNSIMCVIIMIIKMNRYSICYVYLIGNGFIYFFSHCSIHFLYR